MLRSIAGAAALLTLGSASPSGAQAPAAASLWRVATASLAGPPALESGPAATFWQPAARTDGRTAAGLQMVLTSDIVGLSGVITGVTTTLGAHARIGVQAARVDVRDLVRTTTTPNSQFGTIPVFEQMIGVTARVTHGPLAVGASLRLHDARFDALRDAGATLDMGAELVPHPRVRLAVATQFLPLGFEGDANAAYLAAAEYAALPHAEVEGLPMRLTLRYGVAYRSSGDWDHAVGFGTRFYDALSLDAAITGESAFGMRSWRPAVGLGVVIGRYTLGITRSDGLNDLGATYRVRLDVEVRR